MKVKAVGLARSIWLFPAVFMNPYGRNIVPMMSDLAERYRFLKVPDLKGLTSSPLDLKFESGTFIGSDGAPIFVSLRVHDDGLIVDTRTSTDESDRIMHDLLSWGADEFSLPSYSDFKIEKLYSSMLDIEMDAPLEIFNEKFSMFTDLLESRLRIRSGPPMKFAAIHFGPDPTKTSRTAKFRLERLAGIPYEHNYYYSAAPTTTTDHLELLRILEETITFC